MDADFGRPGGLNGAAYRYLVMGAFTLDLQTQETIFEERVLSIPPCTFNYLVTLMRYAPQPVSYKTLVVDSQGYRLKQLQAQDMARMHIYMLRRAIEQNQDSPRYIQSIPGFGYRFVP